MRCRGPAERGLLFTVPDDVRLLDLDGHGDLDGYAPPNELPLHTETLRARPDVNVVVHAHPPAVVAADLAGARLLPILAAFNMTAARLAADGIPVYPRGVLIRRRDPLRRTTRRIGAAMRIVGSTSAVVGAAAFGSVATAQLWRTVLAPPPAPAPSPDPLPDGAASA